MLPLGLLALLAALMTAAPAAASPYFADWSALTRDREPLCVDIPANLSLCHDIGYTKMRLPNLLDHDTLHEVSDQARSWVPLVNIRCHADTQLFLCSLFAPVCLERPIYPCRSLCNKVRLGCEGTMRTNGYPWPQMLQCDKFPVDNDMCITSQSERSREQSGNKEQSVAAVEKKDGENVAAAAGEYRLSKTMVIVARNTSFDGKDYFVPRGPFKELKDYFADEKGQSNPIQIGDINQTPIVIDYSYYPDYSHDPDSEENDYDYDDYDYYDAEEVGHVEENGTSTRV